jgi:hypothetical protein
MAYEGAAQADIRGLQIDKLAKGFADEVLVLKKYCTVSTTSARSIRWYKKNAGFITAPVVTTITGTGTLMANTADKALPVVNEQTWERQTSYVKKYFIESPLFSNEDIKDCDPDVWATNVRDLVQAVANQVDIRILAVLGDTLGTGGSVNTAAAVGTGWDDTAAGNPIRDILVGLENIRTYRYDTSNVVLYIHPGDYNSLIDFLINVKGSSIPEFSSDKVKNGVVSQILGCKVVVSVNASEDTAVMFIPKRACTWKQFTPLQSAVIDDPGIGKKVRVWEEGEALLTDPRAVHVITDTKTA